MRILHIGTDSFGGYGGIALYNRELIAAMASHPRVDEVVVVPRIIVGEREPLPEKVTFVADAARGRLAFLRALRQRRQPPSISSSARTSTSCRSRAWSTKHPLLMLYGIEAWKPLRDPISNRLLRDVRGVVSISDVTLRPFHRLVALRRPVAAPAELDSRASGTASGRKIAALVARYTSKASACS